jgi:hypothetical protein
VSGAKDDALLQKEGCGDGVIAESLPLATGDWFAWRRERDSEPSGPNSKVQVTDSGLLPPPKIPLLPSAACPMLPDGPRAVPTRIVEESGPMSMSRLGMWMPTCWIYSRFQFFPLLMIVFQFGNQARCG